MPKRMNVDNEAYCNMFGHNYEVDDYKSQFYPKGYKVEQCTVCGDHTLTYLAEGMAQFKEMYGQGPLQFLSGE